MTTTEKPNREHTALGLRRKRFAEREEAITDALTGYGLTRVPDPEFVMDGRGNLFAMIASAPDKITLWLVGPMREPVDVAAIAQEVEA